MSKLRNLFSPGPGESELTGGDACQNPRVIISSATSCSKHIGELKGFVSDIRQGRLSWNELAKVGKRER